MISNFTVCYYARVLTSRAGSMSFFFFVRLFIYLNALLWCVEAMPVSAKPISEAAHPTQSLSLLALEHAEYLARQGTFSSARDELKMLIGKYPNNVAIHLAAARFYRSIGAFGLAAKQYQKTIDLGADLSEPYLALAEICIANNDSQQALKYANKSLSLDSSSKRALVALITAQLNTGKFEQARKRLAGVLSGTVGSKDADLNYLAYRLTLERRQLALAKQCLNQAIKLRPDKTDWLLDQADLYWSLAEDSNDSKQKLANYCETRRVLEKEFLVREPHAVPGFIKLGKILEFYFHDYDAAERQYQEILKIDPDYVAAIAGLDRCKAKRNDLAGQMKLEFWKTFDQFSEELFGPYHSRQ